jgi:hypothetical protein
MEVIMTVYQICWEHKERKWGGEGTVMEDLKAAEARVAVLNSQYPTWNYKVKVVPSEISFEEGA